MSPRVKVDETDFRILREIFLGEAGTLHGDRVPIDGIAAALGLHRNTISQRVKRLTDAGVFLPASLDIEPSALGLVASIIHFDVPPEHRTPESRDALFGIPGVQTLIAQTDGWRVISYAEDEDRMRKTVSDIAETLRSSAHRDVMWSPTDYPATRRMPLSDLDARLLILLLKDARTPFPQLAEALGTSAMTAQRRFDRLRDAGVVYLLPSSTTPIEGVVMAWLTADIPHPRDEAKTKRALQELLPDSFVRNLATKARAHFLLFARTVDDIESKARDARETPGVAGVHLGIISYITTNPAYAEWMSRALRDRVEAPR